MLGLQFLDVLLQHQYIGLSLVEVLFQLRLIDDSCLLLEALVDLLQLFPLLFEPRLLILFSVEFVVELLQLLGLVDVLLLDVLELLSRVRKDNNSLSDLFPKFM